MAIIVVDSTGIRAASLSDILEDLQERFRASAGGDLALSPQTPQMQWISIESALQSETNEALVELGQVLDVDHAGGALLDEHGALLDIRRNVATRSRVTATLTGVAGTGVTAGSRAKTDPGGDEFRTLTDVVLSPSGVSVDMEAVETGPVAADAGTLTEIVTIIPGWETITNPEAAALGQDRQSDDAYRATYQDRTAHSSTGPIPALEGAATEALATDRRVVENNTNVAKVVQEWTINPHAILAILEGGSTHDMRRAVENHRGMGAATMTAIRGGMPASEATLLAITNGTVKWGGVDYTGLDLSSLSGPTVVFAGATGRVTAIVVTAGGSGYTSVPAVTITDSAATPGTGATATAVLGVESVTIGAGGSGYTQDTTTVAFSGGGATQQATGTVTVTGGAVTAITITDPGSGYTSVPAVTITDSAATPGTGATGTAVLKVVSVTVDAGGSGYAQATTTATIAGAGGATATATVTETGAEAEAVLENGVITAIRVTDGGMNYASAPGVTITGGAGSGATATATIESGVVTAVAVTAGGSGYILGGVRKATALTTLLSAAGVTVAFIDGAYVAQFEWQPDKKPNFGDNTVTQAFGFDPDSQAFYPTGPFVRPKAKALTVSFTLTRRPGFPADGLQRVQQNVLDRVKEYGIGEEIWANDLLCEAERVAGTRITLMVVQAGSVAVSGVAVSLDNKWTLDTADLSITVA